MRGKMEHLPWDQVNAYLCIKQHLIRGKQQRNLAQIAQDLAGIHATGASRPYMALFNRVSDFQRQDLDQALYQDHTLAKVRCVRNTLYIHPISMLPAVVGATRRKMLTQNAHFLQQRNIPEDRAVLLRDAILALLEDGPHSAAEIKAALSGDASIPAMLSVLSDEGVLLRVQPQGTWRSNAHRYAIFSRVHPELDLDSLSERQATEILVRSYIAAFGPVCEEDVVWWTGLGKRRVGRALQDLEEELAWLQVGEQGMVLPAAQLPQLCATRSGAFDLPIPLPVQDSYLMGYRHRERYLRQEDTAKVFDRAGNATSVLLLAGRIAGVWDEDPKQGLMLYHLFREAPSADEEHIRQCLQELGEFLFNGPAIVRRCEQMMPLTERSMGSMMSPLRD